MGQMRNAFKILVGEPEGKSPLGRPRPGREDDIRMDLRGMGWEHVDGMNLVQVWTSGRLL
jgi:hypothetical protein